jgi:segregation and condensation protein B
MLSDETLNALIEGIIYVAPEPVSLELIARQLDSEERERIRAALDRLIEDYEKPEHGIRIRQVAGGYKFSSKAEYHEALRSFVKSLKPPVRLSKPALETLAVIAYRQPVTLPEIDEIRGVDCGGVIHTLLEKKLIATAGRKNVVGRPILYRTSREFLVHFGLNDLSELPSMREFEEMARQALAPETTPAEQSVPNHESAPVEDSGSHREPDGATEIAASDGTEAAPSDSRSDALDATGPESQNRNESPAPGGSPVSGEQVDE